MLCAADKEGYLKSMFDAIFRRSKAALLSAVMGVLCTMPAFGGYQTSEELYTRNDGPTLYSKVYVVSQNTSIFRPDGSFASAMYVANGSVPVIYIKHGVTLTVTGQNSSGTTSGGAGIRLNDGSTLIVTGGGTLNVTGANGVNGVNGENGGTGWINDSYWQGGGGGTGGAGGAGASAAIGGVGGDAGNGGSGGYNSSEKTSYYGCDSGGSGGSGMARSRRALAISTSLSGEPASSRFLRRGCGSAANGLKSKSGRFHAMFRSGM